MKDGRYLKAGAITPESIEKVKKLNNIANSRGQSLAQMAVAWILRNPEITTVLVGVSKTEQLLDNLKALENLIFTMDELNKIDSILK